MAFRGRLLLIDDDHADRMAVADSLRERRWFVETASNARLATDAALRGQPDIVVAAIELPDIHRVQLVRTLRSCVDHDIMLVGLSRHGSTAGVKARASGYSEVFTKPVDLDALDRFLGVAIAAPRSAR